MFELEGLINFVLSILAGLIAIVVHEYPKAAIAVLLGDNTPKYNGKMTINPLKHLDPIGFIMLISSYVGWSYPVEFNPNNFKNKKRDTIIVSSIGIIFSLLFTMCILLLRKQLPSYESGINYALYANYFLTQLTFYSLSLAVINLLPIPPLSITKIISIYWPRTYFRILQYEKMVHVVFLLLLFLNIIPLIIINIVQYLLLIMQMII